MKGNPYDSFLTTCEVERRRQRMKAQAKGAGNVAERMHRGWAPKCGPSCTWKCSLLYLQYLWAACGTNILFVSPLRDLNYFSQDRKDIFQTPSKEDPKHALGVTPLKRLNLESMRRNVTYVIKYATDILRCN